MASPLPSTQPSHTLRKTNSYIRMLFVDFSSAFNTISPRSRSANSGLEYHALQLNIGLPHKQTPRQFGLAHSPPPLSVQHGSPPQGRVLSPLLFTLYTHDCIPRHEENSVVKFVDDTTVIGRISNNDETSYREEIDNLAEWCSENNLLLNISKTKELMVDFRKKEVKTHTPVYISGAEVEQVNSFRFLGISITENLTWSSHISRLVKKAQKQLNSLRKKAKFLCQVLVSFYRREIESILTGNITHWHGMCSG